MALVKKSALAGRVKRAPTAIVDTAVVAARPPVITQKAVQPTTEAARERIGAASSQLAAGLTEAAGAAAELAQTMAVISGGAEEAAGAVQESLSVLQVMAAAFEEARRRAEQASDRTGALKSLAAQSGAEVAGSIAAVQLNAARQAKSVEIMGRLETQAARISGLIAGVADIAAQTDMMAINAALEADRAGDAGRGFTVLADEIRSLADAAQQRAQMVALVADQALDAVREVGERLARSARIAAEESQAAGLAQKALAVIGEEMTVMSQDADRVLGAAVEAAAALDQARRGGEVIASAAEEQAAAAAEAQSAVDQQTRALEQSDQAAGELARMTDLVATGVSLEALGEIATAAEELSSTIQELAGSASQILGAVDQIQQGAQAQASATQEASAALAQIEAAAGRAELSGKASLRRAIQMQDQLAQSRKAVGRLTAGVELARGETEAVLQLVHGLDAHARRIGRSSEALGLLAVRTNMLAVSGAAEAARAASAGLGFGAVSSDVRKLAETAASNAEQVRDVVDEIMGEAAIVRRDLETIAHAAAAEVERNSVIDRRLGQMAQEVDVLKAGAEDILQGAEQIVVAVAQSAAGASQIAAAADQAGGASLQAAAAARQQARTAEDLAAAIEEIALLADALQGAAS